MSLCWRFSRNSLDYTDSIERSKVAVYRRVIGRDNPGNETHRTHAGPVGFPSLSIPNLSRSAGPGRDGQLESCIGDAGIALPCLLNRPSRLGGNPVQDHCRLFEVETFGRCQQVALLHEYPRPETRLH